MDFIPHLNLNGQHAFLSPSNYYWLGYDKDTLTERYINAQAKERGTRLHALAKDMILLGIQAKDNKQTFNRYVNDAIAHRMTPEQPLYYSPNCFGTADAIAFRRSKLRIHDLKTGLTEADMRQLYIYAALFCLEYKFKPADLNDIELRIYQFNDIQEEHPEAEKIEDIMSRIIERDQWIEEIKMGA